MKKPQPSMLMAEEEVVVVVHRAEALEGPMRN